MALPVLRIEPRSGWVPLDLSELLQFRVLLVILAWRNVRVRYKQTLAGITWVILQPLLTMVVFSVFFGRWLDVSSGDVPYPIFTFCALVPWAYFVHAMTMASGSVVTQQAVISKVYFPRLLLPLASVLGGLVDLIMSLLVLIPLMIFYGFAPGFAIFTLPFFVLMATMTALAFGLWLAAINVRFRDVNQGMPFISQLWLFLTPVAYPLSVVPEAWRPLYEMNPMTGVVEGFRWALAGEGHPPGRMMLVSLAVLVLVLVGGLYWFRREETTFADLV